MTNQTTKLKMANTAPWKSVEGYQPGRSRTGSYNAISAIAYGVDIPIGRVVVYSPYYNQQVAAGVDNPERSVCLPDKDGSYVKNPLTNKLLSAEPTTLAAMKADGSYRVAGAWIEGDHCREDNHCFTPPPWPVGDTHKWLEHYYGDAGRPGTVMTRGYVRMRIGEDINIGDTVGFADETDNTDPNVGLIALGAVVKAANAVQALPKWQVITAGKAGQTAEFYIEG